MCSCRESSWYWCPGVLVPRIHADSLLFSFLSRLNAATQGHAVGDSCLRLQGQLRPNAGMESGRQLSLLILQLGEFWLFLWLFKTVVSTWRSVRSPWSLVGDTASLVCTVLCRKERSR